MSAAIEKLTGQAKNKDRFNYSAAEVLPLQIEALNDRFQQQKDLIKLLGLRARDAGTTQITSIDDAYRSCFPTLRIRATRKASSAKVDGIG